MKKLLAVIIMASLFVVGCGNTGEKEVEKTGTEGNLEIVIGLDDSFAPMGFVENGELVGFDIDLAKAVFEEAGVDYKFQPIDWNSKELELKTGNIDCIWNGLSITDKRKQEMLFTEPYLNNRQIIFVLEDSAINAKTDLVGKVVGVQAGSTSLNAVEKDSVFQEIGEISEYDTNVNAILDLDIGRVEAVVCDEIVGRYYIENLELTNNIRVLDEDFGGEEYGIATRMDDTETNKLISDNLKAVIEKGEGSEISKKWFGEDILKGIQ
ncbi:MAG: amino acid ABC transporter substrate-binding protein [Lachnospirales bacterium]